MQSILTFLTVIFVAFLAQTTIVPYFSIGKIQPDLVLVVVSIYAFIEGPILGSLAGFTGGLLQDLMTIRNMGLGSLSKTVAGYFAGLMEKNLIGENLILPMVAVFSISLISQIVYVLLSFLVGDIIALHEVFFRLIIPCALYDGLLALPIYLLLLKLLMRQKDVYYLEDKCISKKKGKLRLK